MLREQYDRYVSHLAEVRQLSSPGFVILNKASDYGELLSRNFKRIGELAESDRELLSNYLYPLIESCEPLSPEESKELTALCQKLLDASYTESLDAPIVALVTERLMNDALAKNDVSYAIEQLDAKIVACYTLLSMTMRLTCSPTIAEHLRDQGLKAASQLLAYLDLPAFMRLSEQEREIVLTNARYATVLFESSVPTPSINERSLEMLDKALALSANDAYLAAVPHFDWDYYVFRTLEYSAMSTDMRNVRAFTPSQLKRIERSSERLAEMWRSNPAHYEAYAAKCEVDIAFARNRFLSGHTTIEQYQEELLRVYDERELGSYTTSNAYAGLLAPLEYLLTLSPERLTERDKNRLTEIYEDVCVYAIGVAKERCLGFVLEYFSLILENFIEVPGGMTFEEMGLRCLAALHPPTYVHSVMVGLITRCLTTHLVRLNPQLFCGMLGCQTPEDVTSNQYAIVDFAYHAAVCHDFGKLPLIDTIFVYGRDLLDFEFGLIKQHPAMGARMLATHESTKNYANAALRHHLWYDGTNGYPTDAATGTCTEQTVIDLITCADCMDAATDSVGRSYRRGKTLDQYVAEVEEGAGTRYAPYLSGLLARDEVRLDLEYLLDEGRKANYRNAYQLLRDVQSPKL